MTDFEPSGEWAEELAELALRREQVRAMGGPEAVAKFREGGRLDARARIDVLLDPGTFREFGRIAGRGRYDADARFQGMTPTSAIFGTGRDRRLGRRLHAARRIVRGDDLRQVGLRRADVARAPAAAGAPGRHRRRQREAAREDGPQQDPRLFDVARGRVAARRPGGRRRARRVRGPGRDQGAAVALLGSRSTHCSPSRPTRTS
jgi:hypothetical protein